MSNFEYYQFNRDITNTFIPLFREVGNPIQYNNRPTITNSDKNPLDKDNLDLLLSKHGKHEFHFINGIVIEVPSFITVSELLDIFNKKRLPVPILTFLCQRKIIPLLNSNDILINAFPAEKVYITWHFENYTPTQIN